MYRLSTDVGGTFTDGVLLNENTGECRVSKVLTTPQNPAIGTVEAMDRFGVPLAEVEFLVHGTTVVINALIEGKGAKTGLVTTKGFRDVLEIGRGNRTEMYDALYRKPVPLVPRYLRLEVEERVGPGGEILTPLREADVLQAIGFLRSQGVESVAVCLLNAYANPKHEEDIGELLREHWPEVTVSLSHKITRRFYEYERTSTAAQNAYVMPRVRRYLENLDRQVEERGFKRNLQIMQSNGGIMASVVAREIPIAMVESGPAAGAMGAAHLARMSGYENVISYDMGGTTAKTALIRRGLPETTDQYLVEGRPILLPVVDLREIGAGGGSIAWVDEAGALHVGPQSAGAEPGPACYLRGGVAPTVTDANLHLGILNPDYFLGGEMQVSPQAAHAALRQIAQIFEMSVDETALGVIRIVNTHMAGLLQSMTIKRGYDPREFVLVAFGGAGPIHAAAIARELNIPTVIVPPSPGTFSAWGMLMADLRHDLVRTYFAPMEEASPAAINAIFRELKAQLFDLFAHESVAERDIVVYHSFGLRYAGQEHTLDVEAPLEYAESDRENLERRFDELHFKIYGHNAPAEPKEIVSLKLVGVGTVTKPSLLKLPRGKRTPGHSAVLGKRKVYRNGGRHVDFLLCRRAKLLAGNVIPGPAIIEEPTATTVVEDDQVCSVDAYGNLVISTKEEGR